MPKSKSICPNCGKEGVEAIVKRGYLGHATSRISSGSKTKYFRVGESVKIVSGCYICGKTLKELIKINNDGKSSHKQRIRRLKDAGIPTRIEG
jgi:hypothetical protein